MSFLSIFRSQMPEIIKRLENVRSDLYATQASIERLMQIEKDKLFAENSETTEYEKLIKTILDCLGIALWAKDKDGRFIAVNKICCETILKCSEEEALNFTNGELENDALAKVCMESDKKVMESLTTRRFLENAIYKNGKDNIFVDTIKSPLFNDGELVGTTGSAVDITDIIPDEVKKKRTKSSSIEIPLNTAMEGDRFTEFLERRKIPRICNLLKEVK